MKCILKKWIGLTLSVPVTFLPLKEREDISLKARPSINFQAAVTRPLAAR